jgi:O-antigen/teichoic acid export membrane protein
VVGLLVWVLAPVASGRIAAGNPQLQQACVWSLRITAVLVLWRAIETVCVSTQRAFERYGVAIGASVVGRLLALTAAAAGPIAHRGVVAVMAAAAIAIAASVGVQLWHLGRLLGSTALRPAFERDAIRMLMGFGIFTWIQAVSGVVFAQADRVLTGLSFGAAAVAGYALCAQLAQPVYGIAASGLHFLFPYVSARAKAGSLAGVRRQILLTFGANLLLIAIGAGALLVWGELLLTKWVGPSMAQAGNSVLPLLVWSTAAQGLSITGAYTLLALGQVRWVTFLSLGGGVAMLVTAPFLLRRFGIEGMAIARLLYGPCMLLVYVLLARSLFVDWRARTEGAIRVAGCEEVAR